MAKCTCLLKHTNGGVCNCSDNWEEDYEDGDVETQEEENDCNDYNDYNHPDNRKRNIFRDDDIVH